MSEWQPIDSAPKESGKYLFCFGDSNGQFIKVVELGFTVDDNWYLIGYHSKDPTHWMPLPEPPIEKEENDSNS